MLFGQAKKQGKQSNISDLRAQLDLLDLKIVQVTADGNCFFRFVFIGESLILVATCMACMCYTFRQFLLSFSENHHEFHATCRALFFFHG